MYQYQVMDGKEEVAAFTNLKKAGMFLSYYEKTSREKTFATIIKTKKWNTK